MTIEIINFVPKLAKMDRICNPADMIIKPG